MRQRPLPIAAPPSNVDVHRRPPPPAAVYDWTDDPEMADTDVDGWLVSELGEPT